MTLGNAPTLLDQSDDRALPPGFEGDLYLWDIDKTYLDTAFSSWRGLLRIPLELAIDKVALPGSVPLLRGLRRGRDHHQPPLYFISGSPLQLRSAIQRKMTLDGVDFDGITFKDQWRMVMARRIQDVRRQVGYKLKALLAYTRRFRDRAAWWMFGDDYEQDAEIFDLFGRVVAGLRGPSLRMELGPRKVHHRDVQEILSLAEDLPIRKDPVERIFILAHRYDGTPPTDRRTVRMPTFLTAALMLAESGRVQSHVIAAVAKDLRGRGVSEDRIRASVEAAGVQVRLSPHSLQMVWSQAPQTKDGTSDGTG